MAIEKRDCPLCNNPDNREGFACEICGGYEYKLFKILPVTFLYPYEAKFINWFVIIVFVLVILTFFIQFILEVSWILK